MGNLYLSLVLFKTGIRISPIVSDPDRSNLGQVDPDLGCLRLQIEKNSMFAHHNEDAS